MPKTFPNFTRVQRLQTCALINASHIMLKVNTFKGLFGLCVLLSTILVAQSLTTEQELKERVLQISPSALQSLRNHFDIMVVLVKQGKEKDQIEDNFLAMVQKLNATTPATSRRLFGIIDLADDVQSALTKFNFSNGTIQLMTRQKIYAFSEPIDNFIDFYRQIVLPELVIAESFEAIPINTVVLTVNKTEADYARAQELSNFIIESAREFGVSITAIRGQISEINLKLQNRTIKYNSDPEDIPSILQFISVQTLPFVFQITDDNYHRVFGSPIDKQVLLVYNESLGPSTVYSLRSTLLHAAHHNRFQQLRFQRLIFAAVSMSRAVDLFGDLLEDLEGVQWKLLITKTDFSSFQLERYLYVEEKLDEELLGKFIEDFRMKRLEPYYRSEKRPQKQEVGDVWRVVGKTFEEFVYGNRDRSALILFIDSKDPASYEQWEKEFRGFSEKYKEFLIKEVAVGIFDLALNEHQLLHLDYAPQIVLFEKTNKKKARSYKGELNEDAIRDWLNYWVKPLNIPEDFGKKPLELGL